VGERAIVRSAIASDLPRAAQVSYRTWWLASQPSLKVDARVA
jgi:hypothetical protein